MLNNDENDKSEILNIYINEKSIKKIVTNCVTLTSPTSCILPFLIFVYSMSLSSPLMTQYRKMIKKLIWKKIDIDRPIIDDDKNEKNNSIKK